VGGKLEKFFNFARMEEGGGSRSQDGYALTKGGEEGGGRGTRAGKGGEETKKEGKRRRPHLSWTWQTTHSTWSPEKTLAQI